MELTNPKRSDIIVCEISGRRPGTSAARPTEALGSRGLDFVIISNDSSGYITDYPIVNVPESFQADFCRRNQVQRIGWQAPCNRAYAIEYARARGYRYCLQVDDNIESLSIAVMGEKESGGRRRELRFSEPKEDLLAVFADVMIAVLKHSNAGLVGPAEAGIIPSPKLLKEVVVWFMFTIDLERCAGIEFHGGVCDDMDYELKLNRAGIPQAKISCLLAQKAWPKGDVTGNRQFYRDLDDEFPAVMRRIYSDVYTPVRKYRRNAAGDGVESFWGHRLRYKRAGLFVDDPDALAKDIAAAISRLPQQKVPDRCAIRQSPARN